MGFKGDTCLDTGYFFVGGDGYFHYAPPHGFKPDAEFDTFWNKTIFGSWVMLERHLFCECSYCGPLPKKWSPCCNPMGSEGIKPGLNLPECKNWNAWIVFHWRWRGAKWYLRFTRGRLFGAKNGW